MDQRHHLEPLFERPLHFAIQSIKRLLHTGHALLQIHRLLEYPRRRDPIPVALGLTIRTLTDTEVYLITAYGAELLHQSLSWLILEDSSC